MKRHRHDSSKIKTILKRRGLDHRHGLQTLGGRTPVPDLPVEYERPEQDVGRVGLELATDPCRAQQFAEKARGGFKFCTHEKMPHCCAELGGEGVQETTKVGERCEKDTVQGGVHPFVHLKG